MNDTPLHLGIDAGEYSLKVVLYNAKEKSLAHMAALDLPLPALTNIPMLEEALKGWLDGLSISPDSLASVSLTVPTFRAIAREVFVPPEVPDIAEYLKWYLSTIVNDHPERYILDYQTLSGSAELGWTVLFIALREEWVDAVRKGFRNRKLEPHYLNVDVAVLLNYIEVACENPQERRCFVKADYAGISLMWISKDKLHLLRGVSTLELVGKEQADAFRILSEGIAKEIAEASAENGIKTENVILCGDVSADPAFVEVLTEKLQGFNVKLLDSFEKIQNVADEKEAALTSLCVGALGVALSAAEGV